jgi:hypothetical protein
MTSTDDRDLVYSTFSPFCSPSLAATNFDMIQLTTLDAAFIAWLGPPGSWCPDDKGDVLDEEGEVSQPWSRKATARLANW